MVEGRLNLQAGHLAARILGRNSASKLLFVFGVIFLLLIIVVLFLAVEMPRCNVLKMPCEIDEKGKVAYGRHLALSDISRACH